MSIDIRIETTEERTARLKAIAAEGSARFAALESELEPIELINTVLAWAADQFGDTMAVASSMVNSVLPHLVSQHQPGVDILFGDTGYHFPETIETRNRVNAELDVTVIDITPVQSVAKQDHEYGPNLFERDPGECCNLRKVQPLRQALTGYDAWITGVRREEGPTRANAPLISFDRKFGLVKINPLVTWNSEALQAYAAEHNLPFNPLLEQGYPSIGCAPCTRPVAPGEDPRSGRWAGFNKTECGLHLSDEPSDGVVLNTPVALGLINGTVK